MAYQISQLEIPSTLNGKRVGKKSKRRKLRNLLKCIDYVPVNGRYKGYR